VVAEDRLSSSYLLNTWLVVLLFDAMFACGFWALLQDGRGARLPTDWGGGRLVATTLLPARLARDLFPTAGEPRTPEPERATYPIAATAGSRAGSLRVQVEDGMAGHRWTADAARLGEPVAAPVPAFRMRDGRIVLAPRPDVAVLVRLTGRRFAAAHAPNSTRSSRSWPNAAGGSPPPGGGGVPVVPADRVPLRRSSPTRWTS
jgi:hypothetical protein